ncbi:hypothetical protein X975_22868, partial [Stegodyphus mimosarum]
MEQDYDLSSVFVVNTAGQKKKENTLATCFITGNVDTNENCIDEENSSHNNDMVIIDNSQGNECDDSVIERRFSSEQSTADIEPDKLTCVYCLKTFSTPGNKNRHVRRVHKQRTETGNYKCIECNICFRYMFGLRQHLQEVHGMNMQVEVLRFSTMQGFKKWKCEIERKTLCFYFLRTKNKRQNRLLFYSCHRSGNYVSKLRGPRQRISRSEGTCKTGILCTSSIICRINSNDIIVKYCPYHYGHGKETTVMHLTPQEQR